MTVKRMTLCCWIAWPAKPGVHSSNTSRVRFTVILHTPVRSRIYHIHILYKQNWDGSWLMNLTQKVTRTYIFFKFAICYIALLSLGKTCHLKGRDMVTVWQTVLLLSCYNCDSTRQHYDVTQFEYVLWRRTMHECVMNIHYQTWIAQGRFINMIRTPSKQWACVIMISLSPSIRPNVRPASRVRSVAPAVLVGSILYLYILSSNFIRCVACKVSCKISIFEFLAIFLNL